MISEQALWSFQQKAKSKKTNVTLSVDSQIVEELKKDADLFGISLNTRISGILSKHVTFYRHTERQECSIIPSTIWGTIVEIVDEEKLGKILEQKIDSLYTILLHNNKPLTLQGCIKYCFEGICLWSGMYCSVRTFEEKSVTSVIFEHKFGLKWSKALGDAFVRLISMMHPRPARFEAYSNTLKIIILGLPDLAL